MLCVLVFCEGPFIIDAIILVALCPIEYSVAKVLVQRFVFDMALGKLAKQVDGPFALIVVPKVRVQHNMLNLGSISRLVLEHPRDQVLEERVLVQCPMHRG